MSDSNRDRDSHLYAFLIFNISYMAADFSDCFMFAEQTVPWSFHGSVTGSCGY